MKNGNLTITNSEFNYNKASCGGAIAILNGSVLFKNNIISYNTATKCGGAISCVCYEPEIIELYSLNIIHCTINNNKAQDAGAIYNAQVVMKEQK